MLLLLVPSLYDCLPGADPFHARFQSIVESFGIPDIRYPGVLSVSPKNSTMLWQCFYEFPWISRGRRRTQIYEIFISNLHSHIFIDP